MISLLWSLTGLQNDKMPSRTVNVNPAPCLLRLIPKSCNPVSFRRLPDWLAQHHLGNHRRSLCRLWMSAMKSGNLQQRFTRS